MGIRFKKRIKLFKGVYVNVGKKGIGSVSVGGKGLTLNSSGKVTTSLPGTGLSYSSKLTGNKSNLANSNAQSNNANQDEEKTINENKIDFVDFESMANFYSPKKIDKSIIEEKKFNKIWIVFWIIATVMSAGFILIPLIPTYLYLNYKKKKDYCELLKSADEYNNKIDENKNTLIDYLKKLEEKFGFENSIKIVAKHVWVGEAKDELTLSLGEPDKIDESVLKTKTKHTYFYFPVNSRSYSVKVYLENDIVVGWDK